MRTQDKTKFRYLWTGVAFLLLSFSINAKPLSIAIFDTGFCSSKLTDIPKNITVKPSLDVTSSNSDICKKFNVKKRRFHGHHILKELLLNLKESKRELVIYPVIIFDRFAQQRDSYWKKAVEFSKKQNVDVLLTAVGLPVMHKLNLQLLPINFIASGQRGVGIRKDMKLFPHEYLDGSNSILIGNYFGADKGKDNYMINPDLLYKGKINYYFSANHGSSLAVAKSLGRAVKICGTAFNSFIILKKCLDTHAFKLLKEYKSY